MKSRLRIIVYCYSIDAKMIIIHQKVVFVQGAHGGGEDVFVYNTIILVPRVYIIKQSNGNEAIAVLEISQ